MDSAITSTKTATPVSVRRLLFRWLSLPLGALLGLAALIAYPLALYPATAAYDWALMDSALSLSRLIGESARGASIRISPEADVLLRTDLDDHIYYSIHDGHGRLLAGDAQLSPPDLHRVDAGEFLYDATVGRERLRVAALRARVNDADVIVQVAETLVKRQRLMNRILTGMVAIEILVVVVALLLVWFGIAKGMHPLKRLHAELKARSPCDLRPVEESHAPVEVHAIVQALNDLLRRLESAMQAQQRVVANVAHQLRNPLAGLRMHVETVLQQDAPAEWKRPLQPLKSATERAAHLVNQLLLLARAEANPAEGDAASEFDLSAVVQDVAGQWLPRAIAKKMDLGLELNPAFIRGDPALIAELLANLLDNAIAYVLPGGRITIRIARDDGYAVLEVEDNGPGIAEGERAKVFDRFYRIEGSPGGGCGLGLAIVHEIAQIHGGHAEISKPAQGPGTLVIIRFPGGAAKAAANTSTLVKHDTKRAATAQL